MSYLRVWPSRIADSVWRQTRLPLTFCRRPPPRALSVSKASSASRAVARDLPAKINLASGTRRRDSANSPISSRGREAARSPRPHIGNENTGYA